MGVWRSVAPGARVQRIVAGPVRHERPLAVADHDGSFVRLFVRWLLFRWVSG
jgi:hypothetical protein